MLTNKHSTMMISNKQCPEVKYFQGEIFVTSQLGKGSCLTVLLPVTTLEQSL